MIKKIILFAVSLICGITAYAQNIIVTNGGDAIKAYNLEMSGNSVFYQTSVENDAPIQKINKSDILIIKMQDGTKIDPNDTGKQEAAPVVAAGSIIKVSGDAAAKNADLIADFNRKLTWEPDEKFYKKGQGKTGNGYTGIMWVKDDSQLYNGEVTISFQRMYNSEISTLNGSSVTSYRSNVLYNPMVIVKVKNNTDRIIYLDLASCFVISGDDSNPYFVPEITTVSNVNTTKKTSEYTDIKVSDDKLKASDHTYVSGNTSTVISVKEAQRYVSVAPKATLTLDAKPICRNEYSSDCQMFNRNGFLYMNRNVFPFANTMYGEILEIDEEDSPFSFGTCVAYSFNEDHSDLHTIRTEMCMRYVMCTTSTALFAYTIDGDFHKRYPFWISFYVTD